MSRRKKKPTLWQAKRYRGKTVFSVVPPERRSIKKQKPKERENRERFQEATIYAKKCMENPEIKALYKTGITEKKSAAIRVALTDYLNAPVVHYIRTFDYKGNIGDPIRIMATDDFMVTKVEVEIVTPDGKRLEKGQAVRNARREHMWRYTATKVNEKVIGTKIKVVASDRPGNIGSREFVAGITAGALDRKENS
jgi:hypothetical protein